VEGGGVEATVAAVECFAGRDVGRLAAIVVDGGPAFGNCRG